MLRVHNVPVALNMVALCVYLLSTLRNYTHRTLDLLRLAR